MIKICLPILLLFIVIPNTLFAQSSNINGTYHHPDHGCDKLWPPNEKGEFQSCRDWVNCLSVKRVDDKSVWFSVKSNQINGHACKASGLATKIEFDTSKFRDNVLEVYEQKETILGQEERVLFLISDKQLRFLGSGSDMRCGARASWYFAKFPFSTKENDKTTACYKHSISPPLIETNE